MLTSTKTIRSVIIAVFWAILLTAQPTYVSAGSKKQLQAPSVFDINRRKKAKKEVTDWLSSSLYASVRYLGERNIKRDDDDANDRTHEFITYLGIVARADAGNGVIGFFNAEISRKDKRSNVKSFGRIMEPQIKEALVSFELGETSHLNVGRLRFSDLSKWVTDASVDGVHYVTKRDKTVFELSIVSGTRDITADYLIAHASSVVGQQRFGGFAIVERDANQDSFHLAAYLHDKVSDRFSYQLNAAAVMGDATDGRSSGIGFDARAIQKLSDSVLKPQVTYGLAVGSTGFRQTGLHSNKTYDGGQTQFHRYGYVYQPELTNIAVGTLAYGLRPSRYFSLDFGLHAYLQPSRSTIAPDARLKGDTNGTSNFLGTEISLAGAWRPNKKSKVEFGLGRFMPGAAYLDRSKASRVYMRYSYYF